MMLITRKTRFSAAHLCRNPGWTEARNQQVYGSCAAGTGHGHDYEAEFTFGGPVDPRTGVVLNLTEVKQRLLAVIEPLDLSHLNHDHGPLEGPAPTSERLVRYLWHALEGDTGPCELRRVLLRESRTRNIAYTGDDSMVHVTRSVEFNAAHRLHSIRLSDEENVRIFGKCNNPHGHGHNYELEVTVRGPLNEKTGTVIDMGRFDDVLRKEVVDRYDHRHLNRDLEEFRTVNPTSEELLRVIWKRLLPFFDTPSLYRIRLVETSKNAFEYYGEEDR